MARAGAVMLVDRPMLGRIISSAALAFGLLITLASCSDDTFPDYNYKMTIYAGGKAFSSVRRVEQKEIASVQSSSGRTVKRTLQGEAVIIDLNGKTYYALLMRPDNQDYSLLTVTAASIGRLVTPEKLKGEVDAAIEDWRRDQPGQNPNAWLDNIAAGSQAMVEIKGAHPLPRTLPSSYMDKGQRMQAQTQTWPMFVTFADPRDPRTVREVSPDSIWVSNITIEITDEDVTAGINERLAWLPDYHEKMLDGNRITKSNSLSSNLGSRHSRWSPQNEPRTIFFHIRIPGTLYQLACPCLSQICK
jgi:hypothetical protein